MSIAGLAGADALSGTQVRNQPWYSRTMVELIDRWDLDMRQITESDTDELRKLLLGRRVKRVAADHMQLDDGTMVRLVPNEGCGGCTNGAYRIKDLNEVDNVITAVDPVVTIETDDLGREERLYEVFVVAEDRRVNLFAVEGSDGNGFYGTGYVLVVRAPQKAQAPV